MSGSAASPAPRIFVSHSHEDDEYCRAFVDELRRLCGERDAVWYDEHNLTSGELMREIQRQLHQRPAFVVIFTKASLLHSQWVADECTWAYQLYRAEPGRTILPVVGGPIERGDFIPDWLYLEGFRRIEAPGMRPYPPAEAARRTYAALTGTQTAVTPAQAVMPGKPEPQPASRSASVGAPPSPAPAPMRQAASAPPAHLSGHHAPAPDQRAVPTPARPVLPRERFPERLEKLGFVAEMGRDPDTGKEVAFIRPPLCPVPAGPFLMGSDSRRDNQAQPDEQPQITMELPAYQIATFPVTVAEYACFVAAGHAEPREGLFGTDWQTQLKRLDHPVTCVTWRDARDYAAWLAKLTGQPWKLPSEAEWEKAARWDLKGNGGRGLARIYPWGDRFDASRCNTRESGIKTTTPVGSYGPEQAARDGSSPYGAQDMAGNVWEWTRTIYDAQAYSKHTFREEANSTDNRVLRGGSWNNNSRNARAAYRLDNRPGDACDGIGFRVALLSAAPSSF